MSDGTHGKIARHADPLPSWNDGATKRAITDFVKNTTTEGGPDYVRVPDRIALFDNDGTLWVEQPMYTQLAFLLENVRKLAPQHPERLAEHAERGMSVTIFPPVSKYASTGH